MDRSNSYAFSRHINVSATAYVQSQAASEVHRRAKSHKWKYLAITTMESYIYGVLFSQPIENRVFIKQTPGGKDQPPVIARNPEGARR
jgi:hypothetical protein